MTNACLVGCEIALITIENASLELASYYYPFKYSWILHDAHHMAVLQHSLCMSLARTRSELFTKQQTFGLTQIKAFADHKIIVTQKLKFVLGKAENIVENGKNAGYQHFLLFLQCFLKLSSRGVKSQDCVVMGHDTIHRCTVSII